MNRLVIIGNGFDLAHGLPTGYCDFIKWYWERFIETTMFINNFNQIQREDDLVSINVDLSYIDYYNRIEIENAYYSVDSYNNLISFIKNFDSTLRFKNSLFEIINNQNDILNWVDIENEYYKLLKDCLKDNSNSQVIKLNQEFKQIKNFFEVYLKTEVCAKYNFTFNSGLNKFFDIEFRTQPSFFKEFHFEWKDDSEELQQYIQNIKSENYGYGEKIYPTFLNLFLNFNYTPTVDLYIKEYENDINHYGNNQQIQIHGRIGNIDNPINFGFGDEMDDEYANIEKKNDNEYLRYIKSFQYFQNSDYKKVLEFINSGNFQVYIMGHSCGLSDRTLLNTIFENEYCKSIKIFYHEYEQLKKDFTKDNYTEIVQNISRHFSDKKLMRRKVVEKDLCEPLPQTKLSLKENGSQ